MKKTIFLKVMTVAMMAAMCVTLAACGGDDGDSSPAGSGDNGGGGNVKPNSVLFVNGTNYGLLPYAYIMKWNDGAASIIIANQNGIKQGMDQNAGYTQVAVRIPNFTGTIPTGTYSQGLDLDFDINRVYAANTIEMTGWSTQLVMNVVNQGDKYIIDITTENLHTYTKDNEKGDGQKGTLNIHFEGSLEIYGLSLG